MSSNLIDRRKFIAGSALGLGGFVVSPSLFAGQGFLANKPAVGNKKVGIIGLDISFGVSYAKILNADDADPKFQGYKITAAYPYGSERIVNGPSRIERYTNEIRRYGVEIVSSIRELLEEVDVVMIMTNDGTVRLAQTLEVIQAKKPVYLNKPAAAVLKDVMTIYDEAEKNGIPIFSSSSLRFLDNIQELSTENIGKVIGVNSYSPAWLESAHTDLFWYGIHGVEILYTVLGMGCQTVSRVHTPETDIVTGVWDDGRIGVFRGLRGEGRGGYGGMVFGKKKTLPLMSTARRSRLLLMAIIRFFESGHPPVDAQETIELYAFMAAADESKKNNGRSVHVQDIIYSVKESLK